MLPSHVQETVETIAELHRQHHRRSTPTQRLVARLTRFVARPRFVGLLSLALVLWMGWNGLLAATGRRVMDPPPFNGLQDIVGIAGLYITVLILITQRRENELSEARDQLTLELAILNEQKSAKIVALLEELRRDLPTIPNRPDPEADRMSIPADPQAVLDALRDNNQEMIEAVMSGGAD